MATPHISSKEDEIANLVLMPGDPLRAKFIADNFLTNTIEVNSVRNVLAYTGYYNNKRITVFASGMGIPSMAIYAYELMTFYHVNKIIRIGTVGSIDIHANLFDLILVENAITDSSFAYAFAGEKRFIVAANKNLNNIIKNTAATLKEKITIGNIYSSDAFYHGDNFISPKIKEYNCLGIEMESFALLYLGEKLNKETAVLLSVSDSLINKTALSSKEREQGQSKMILLALNTLTNN